MGTSTEPAHKAVLEMAWEQAEPYGSSRFTKNDLAARSWSCAPPRARAQRRSQQGDCHGFCAERAVAHKLRQLHASRETSASFGAFHFRSPSLVCRTRSSNFLKRTQPLPMSSFSPLFLYSLVNQVERARKGEV